MFLKRAPASSVDGKSRNSGSGCLLITFIGLSPSVHHPAEQPSRPFLDLINQQHWLTNHPATTHKKNRQHLAVFLWAQTFTAAIPDR
jgi:hypothetical protein